MYSSVGGVQTVKVLTAGAPATTGGVAGNGTYTDRAAAVTWANANDLVITATTPTAAGDLTLDSYIVELLLPPS